MLFTRTCGHVRIEDEVSEENNDNEDEEEKVAMDVDNENDSVRIVHAFGQRKIA